MARTWHAVCMRCSHTFRVHKESSRTPLLLRCIRCGRVRPMTAAELERIRDEHGLPVQDSLADDNDGPVQKKHRYMIEHYAGRCVCGAPFSFSARPRCPVCRSSVLRKAPRPSPGAVAAPATGA